VAARLRRALALAGGLAATSLGCTPALPTLARGEPDLSRYVIVPYPPPPARVEIVHEPPRALASPCWIDGSWIRGSRDWEWTNGRWVACDAGSEYVPSALVRAPSGELRFVPAEIRSIRPAVRPPKPEKAPTAP
jgi:hypothetical protein